MSDDEQNYIDSRQPGWREENRMQTKWAEISGDEVWALCEANKPPISPPYAGYARTLDDGRVIRCLRDPQKGKTRWEIALP